MEYLGLVWLWDEPKNFKPRKENTLALARVGRHQMPPDQRHPTQAHQFTWSPAC